MSESIKTDDVIFNFFKQICDEKDDQKCLELGKNWIIAMETNLESLEFNLNKLLPNFCLMYSIKDEPLGKCFIIFFPKYIKNIIEKPVHRA